LHHGIAGRRQRVRIIRSATLVLKMDYFALPAFDMMAYASLQAILPGSARG
jgi:hypothetical protein